MADTTAPTQPHSLEWPHQSINEADIGRDWPLVTLDQVVRWGGATLTEDELDCLVAAIPQSSIPQTISALVCGIVATRGDARTRSA